MPKYIFSLGLIPVQDFIAESRRSRDLRAGSAILSWFMRKVLLYLKSKHTAVILIPHASCLNSGDLLFEDILDRVEYSLPNRASGYFEASDADEVLRSLPQTCLQPNWEALFQKWYKDDNYPQNNMGRFKQVFIDAFVESSQCPIDLIWVAKAYDAGKDDSENLENIRQLYDHLKRTRPIQEWRGKPVGKCDQCGKREAVGEGDDYDKWWSWHKTLRDQKWVRSGARLDPGERLCIVCFTKRFAGYAGDKKFPSTSEVAARSWAFRLKHSSDLEVRTRYDSIRSIEEFVDPESLYYKRSLDRKLITEVDEDIKNLLYRVKSIRSELVKKIESSQDPNLKNLKPEPSNYLAVITFDGDSMGKKINHHFEKLPESLLKFAEAVRNNLMPKGADHLAEIFYIGGDEGLLLAPIESALPVAFEIKKLFHEHVKEIDANLTLSMGMAIFDRERPLGNAIRLAHRVLKDKAKAMKGKNALSILIQTASGNEFSTTASWKGDFWERINGAINLMNGEVPDLRLSVGWAYEVEAFLQSLPADRWGRLEFRKAVRSEIKRLTLRKLRVAPKIPLKERRQKQIDAWQLLLAGETWFEPFPQSQDVETISNALHTIAFLCRESAYLTEYTAVPSEGEV